jgi:hypothetical protein
MMLGCRSDLRISLVTGKFGKLLTGKGSPFIHMVWDTMWDTYMSG